MAINKYNNCGLEFINGDMIEMINRILSIEDSNLKSMLLSDNIEIFKLGLDLYNLQYNL
jgi:hypothetical protein